MPITDRLVWDLESLMPGGFSGEAWAAALPAAEAGLKLPCNGQGPPERVRTRPGWRCCRRSSVSPAATRHTYAWLHCMAATHAADGAILRGSAGPRT